MKYLFFVFLCISYTSFGQKLKDDNMVYSVTILSKRLNSLEISNSIKNFNANLGTFYTVKGDKKIHLNGVDTSGYGISTTNSDTAITNCVWVYAPRNMYCDVFKGKLYFYPLGNKVIIELHDLKYYKYELTAGIFVLKETGNYKDLGICLSCNTSGIKVGDVIHESFMHLVSLYDHYIKGLK